MRRKFLNLRFQSDLEKGLNTIQKTEEVAAGMSEGQVVMVVMVVEAGANLFVAVAEGTPAAVAETGAKSLSTETSQSKVHKPCQRILRQKMKGSLPFAQKRSGRNN